MAPEDTINVPPLETPRKAAEPPASTFTVPPEIPVPEPLTPLTTPPDETFSMPPLDTATSLVIVPNTFTVPPLEIVKLCAVPPEDTLAVPPAGHLR